MVTFQQFASYCFVQCFSNLCGGFARKSKAIKIKSSTIQDVSTGLLDFRWKKKLVIITEQKIMLQSKMANIVPNELYKFICG